MKPKKSLKIKVIGILALIFIGATLILGLKITPPDAVQGQMVRIIYIHPPLAWVAFLAYGTTAIASGLYLWKRTRARIWDQLSGASAEVGVVFTGLTLVTGSIWGRPTWGVWWTWDPLLTTTALLFVLYLGYLALRKLPGDIDQRSKRSAIAALIAFIDVPIVQMSVLWWHSLHQKPTVFNPGQSAQIHGIMADTLLIGFIAFTLVWLWLLLTRLELMKIEEKIELYGLGVALQERRSEANEDSVGAFEDGVSKNSGTSSTKQDPDQQLMVKK